MLRIVCVRQCTLYGPEYIRKLHAMVARNITLGVEGEFVCFTDQPDEMPPQITVRPLPEGVTGWWAKLWLFSPGLFPEGDRIVYFDLDTVIVGDLDQICAYKGEFAILRDFYRPEGWQSAVMAWPSGFGAWIWEGWLRSGRPEKLGGDQEWIELCLYGAGTVRVDRWQDLYPGKFVSYKRDCKPFPPEDASVVVFHGEPRPHNCATPWVAAMWSEGDTGHFHLAMIANVTLDQIREQSKLSAARKLARLTTKPAHDGKVAIVGGGPSLGDPLTAAELSRHVAAGGKVWALNATYGWLAGRGITADAFLILDARADNVRFAYGISPKSTAYVSSQCHPDVYDALSPDQVIRFDLDVMGDCGTTVGTHAILIAHVEGFREIHLFGFDSSYRGGAGHAYQQSMNADERIVDAHIGDRVYRAAPWMIRQAQDFETIARDIASAGGALVVHGDGLLPYMASLLANPVPSAADIRAREVLRRLNGAHTLVGAEIGVFAADMSVALLRDNRVALAMVDSWEGTGEAYEGDSGDWHAGLTQEMQDAYCELAQRRVVFAGDRVNLLRMRSDFAAAEIADASLDFVFIDADHSYEGCQRDIEAWLPKLKCGALLSGHDYDNPDFPKFGVKRAVDEFAASIGQTVDLGENFTWFLRKD